MVENVVACLNCGALDLRLCCCPPVIITSEPQPEEEK